jgi:hypothetical protein
LPGISLLEFFFAAIIRTVYPPAFERDYILPKRGISTELEREKPMENFTFSVLASLWISSRIAARHLAQR